MIQNLKAATRLVLGAKLTSKLKIRQLPNDALTIFSLHNIVEDTDHLSRGIPASAFTEFMIWVNDNFTLTTFGQLDKLEQVSKPLAILSFDDGYLSYKCYVEPLLIKLGVEANLNVIPAAVESGRAPINVVMQDMIHQGNSATIAAINIAVFGGRLDTKNPELFALSASRALKGQPIELQATYWHKLEEIADTIDSFKPVKMLNLEQVRSLQMTELGAHSYEHASMAAEAAGYFQNDVKKCQTWFEKNLAAPAKIYAFPNGDASAELANEVLAYGYSHSLLVGERISRKGQSVHNRINVHGQNLNQLRSCMTRANV